MEDIATRLREVRRRTGLGTRGFASELQRRSGYGLSHSSVSQYESGTTVPASYTDAVARAFQIDPRWLLSGEGLPERIELSEVERAFSLVARAVQRVRTAPSTVESQFDAFFRLSPDVMQILTTEGYIIRSNPACEAVAGFPPDAMVNSCFIDFLHPEDRPRARQILDRLPTSEGPAAFEVRHRRTDGTFVWMSWVAAHSDGLIYATGRDITSVRETNRALRLERDFMEGVLAVAEALVVVADRSGGIVRINRRAASIVGMSRTDALGLPFQEVLLPPERRGSWPVCMRSILEGEQPRVWESEILSNGGEAARIRWSFTGLRGEDGEVSHIVGLGVDVTEQRRAVEQLRTSEEMLAAVVDSAPDGLLMVDRFLRIRWTNRRLTEIFGYPAGALTGERVEILLPEDVRAAHQQLSAAYLRDGQSGSMAAGRWVTGRRRDGTEVEVEVLLSPIPSGETGVVARVTARAPKAGGGLPDP